MQYIDNNRLSNIELCRIFSIFLVLLVHSQFHAQGMATQPSSSAYLTYLLEGLAVIGVNAFILISGYFSIKLKLKSILNFIYICLFYGIIINIYSLSIGDFDSKNLFFISNSNWFIPDYFGLMIISPILNKFVESSSKKTFSIVLLLFIIYQTWFGWVPGKNIDFQYGYSIISFSVIYLIGRYLKIYQINIPFKYAFSLFIIITVANASLAFFAMTLGMMNITNRLYCYNNPIIIFNAILFFYIFKSFNIKNNKWVNHIAKSTLTILILHINYYSWQWLKPLFVQIKNDFNAWQYLIILLVSILAIMSICVIIDQIRLLSYSYIEKKINKSNRYKKIARQLDNI